MEFKIHNECGHVSAEEFLDGFLEPVTRSLAAHLGRLPVGPTHVVLSDRDSHETRFPPRAGEVLELEDLSEDPEQEPEEIAQRYVWSSYAHGVTTHAATWQHPPSGVRDGDLSIYLDIESIQSISDDLDVLFEGMLGRVAAHELSHAVRGHATEPGRATHGWFREGDAQRDAWHVLVELLADSTWAYVARWGRAAQVRLADRQPAAYRFFGIDQAERSRLLDRPPVDPPTAWILRSPRAVLVLAHDGPIETPVCVPRLRILGSPSVGDHMYLGDADMLAGPWVVVAIRNESRLSHPEDQAAIDRYEQELRSTPQVEWLHLRPFGSLLGAATSDVSPGGTLIARELKPEEITIIEDQLVTPVEKVAPAEK